MAIVLTATLLSASAPRPVQVALTGTAAGQRYEIRGTASDGSSWGIPGGVGVSTGSQVLLIDNRTALNSTVTYQAIVDGVAYTSAPVSVLWDGVAVLQSIDGQTIVNVEIASVLEPRKGSPRVAVFDIAHRSDPALRMDIAGSDVYSWMFDTQLADSAIMREILKSGQPVVRRTVAGMRDLDAVVLGVITGWSDSLISEGEHTWRRWSLTVREIADPQPSTALVAYTWDDFDAAMVSRTWAGFDALFGTWEQFDAADWTQYL